MNPLRVGVVGVGALGRHHARILAGLPGARLAAVAECDEARGREIADAYGAAWFPDHTGLLERVDAVTVVVPTVHHLSVAGDFLRRGVPVLVEKPLAVDVAQGRVLVELAAKHDTLLQVGHVERFNPALQAAAAATAAPKYIRGERTSPFTFRSTDIGAVLDLMIHDIDLVLAMVPGEIRNVTAFGVGVMGGAEDAVTARLTFEGGCVVDLTASRISPVVKRELQIWSAAGCVSANLHTRDVIRFAPSDALRFGPTPTALARQPGADVEQLKRDVFGKWIQVESLAVPDGDALTAELASFVDCVRQRTRPLVDGAAGLRALEVAEHILDCVARHQWDGSANGPVGPNAGFNVPRKRAG